VIGAVIGDVIGSVHEFMAPKHTQFELFSRDTQFTDDTVLTMATAKALLDDQGYEKCYRDFVRRYPGRIYGHSFQRWAITPGSEPYNSWGNGSAMRVSPIGYAAKTVDETLEEAKKSAEVSHNHPEGIKGAQATALAIFLARKGSGKEEIRLQIQERFGYDLDRTIAEIRPRYLFNESCQKTVPEAIISVLDARDFEGSLRLAISLGGDADTLACIAGGIAQAVYGGVPQEIRERVLGYLPDEFKEIITRFEKRYPHGVVG